MPDRENENADTGSPGQRVPDLRGKKANLNTFIASSGQPLLSICIPTYNRAVYLKEALESLSVALQGNEAGIEIVVSDNASTDETSSILSAFRGKYPSTHLYRNPENIGGEPNFYRVIELAKGKYIWVFGDDDKITADFISEVRTRLENDPDLVICNYSVHAKDFSFAYKNNLFSTDFPGHFDDRDAVLGAFGAGLGYLSSVVLRRELFFKVSRANYDRYAPFGFSFLYAVYGGLPSRVRACFINRPLVLYRGNNPGGLDWERCFIDGLALVFAELKQLGYSPASVQQAKNRSLHVFIRSYVVGLKIKGKATRALLRRVYGAYGKCHRFWLEIVPVFLIPGVVIKLIKRALKRPT